MPLGPCTEPQERQCSLFRHRPAQAVLLSGGNRGVDCWYTGAIGSSTPSLLR
jgi:hypothetical protein